MSYRASNPSFNLRSAVGQPIATGVALLLGVALRAAPTFTVVPRAYSSPAAVASAMPFGQTSVHYQQVFAAGQFTTGGAITEISFRPAGTSTATSPLMPLTLGNATITLSTTSAAPGALGANFLGNLGSDATVVYTGPLTLSTSYTGPAGGPFAFDVRIHLPPPFFSYNPTNGNLIMDVVLATTAGAVLPALDGQAAGAGSAASSAYATPSAGAATTLSGATLVTQFTFGSFAVPTGSKLSWIISNSNANQLYAMNPTVAQYYFNTPSALLFGSYSGNPNLSDFPSATPAADFQSFKVFQAAVLGGNIGQTYANQVVMYDNEDWTETPTNEQQAPANYEQLFADLAHAYGYAFVSTPASDMVPVQSGYVPGVSRYTQYISMGFPAMSAGAPAEGYDIQAQDVETPGSTPVYAAYVQSCVTQAHAANSATVVVSGVTTTNTPPASAIETAIISTGMIDAGCWFNIPDGNFTLAMQVLTDLQSSQTPVFSLQPTSSSVVAGQAASFSVSAPGNFPVEYQWYFNGSVLAGQTGATLTLSDVQEANAGSYTCVVTNPFGTVPSSAATLTVLPPVISSQPASVTLAAGQTASFFVAATGTQPVSYQWYLNNTAVTHATDAYLLVTPVSSTNAGSYTCAVTNSAGTTLSTAATLTLSNSTDLGRLTNVSVRTNCGTGSANIIAGFVIGGSGTNSSSKELLVRADGPELGGEFSVPDFLPDPSLDVFNTAGSSPVSVGQNTGWCVTQTNENEVIAAGSAVYAFPLTTNSASSAVVLTLPSDSYTENVTGASNDTGIALAEVYDVSNATETYSPTIPRLVNVSARANVAPGAGNLIAGFTIGGSTDKTVLVRGTGPGLSEFGLTGLLDQPTLAVYSTSSGDTLVATNTGWAEDPVLAAAAAGVYAFAQTSSADSALLVTLPPGTYTANLNSGDGTSGLALVEVYEVPKRILNKTMAATSRGLFCSRGRRPRRPASAKPATTARSRLRRSLAMAGALALAMGARAQTTYTWAGGPLGPHAKPTFTVVPNTYSSTAEVAAGSAIPFGQTSVHYQQVYAASQFTTGGKITEIAFRPPASTAGGAPLFPLSLAGATITLATTSVAPGSLGTNFSANLGSSPTQVFSGTLSLSTSYTGQTTTSPIGPNAYDVRIYLNPPYFTYNPAAGNLILDVVLNNTSGTVMVPLDIQTVTANPVTSSVYSIGGGTTTLAPDTGLMTQFTFGTFGFSSTGQWMWIISGSNVGNLNASYPTLAQNFFNTPGALLFGGPAANPVPSGFPAATPALYITSFSAFQSDVVKGSINSAFAGQCVMYDNEAWTKTPETAGDEEQTNPAAYEALFANLAHANGYAFIPTPSNDLEGASNPNRFSAYLAAGFPTFSATSPADMYEVQSQDLEITGSSPTFSGFVESADSMAAAAVVTPPVMMAAISTDPENTTQPASSLETAIEGSTNQVSGYWLNIPDGNYTLAAQVLSALINYAPTITTQPAPATFTVGQTATLSVSATDTGGYALDYQWYFNGTAISGATGATLTLSSAQVANTGPYTCTVTDLAGLVTSSAATLTVLNPPTLQGVVSQKTQGTAGTYGIGVAYTSTTTAPATPYPVECRANGTLSLVLSFNKAISSAQASVAAGTATAGTPVCSGDQATVPLTGVANAQSLVVDVANIAGTDGSVLAAATVGVRVLAGDVNGDGVVDISDINLVRAASGAAVGPSNFQDDLNADGSIDISDINLVRAASGTSAN